MKTVIYYTAEELKALIQKAVENDKQAVKGISFTVMRDDGARLNRNDFSVECSVEIEDRVQKLVS